MQQHLCILSLPHQATVLASLITPQVIDLLINLSTEVHNLLLVNLPHFVVQIIKPAVINMLTNLLNEVNNHPKTYQVLINRHCQTMHRH